MINMELKHIENSVYSESELKALTEALNIQNVSNSLKRKPVPRRRIVDEIDFFGSTK